MKTYKKRIRKSGVHLKLLRRFRATNFTQRDYYFKIRIVRRQNEKKKIQMKLIEKF